MVTQSEPRGRRLLSVRALAPHRKSTKGKSASPQSATESSAAKQRSVTKPSTWVNFRTTPAHSAPQSTRPAPPQSGARPMRSISLSSVLPKPSLIRKRSPNRPPRPPPTRLAPSTHSTMHSSAHLSTANHRASSPSSGSAHVRLSGDMSVESSHIMTPTIDTTPPSSTTASKGGFTPHVLHSR